MASPPTWARLSAALVRRLPVGRYRLANWLGQWQTPAFWARTPLKLGGRLFACYLRDCIARDVYFTGSYEPQETALVQRLLRPGMTFVDVGANWGFFTLLAAHCTGATGRVIALEPDPRLFALLQANLRRNGLDFVVAHQLAAADRADVLHLAGFDEQAGNWGLSRLTNQSAAGTFAVQAGPIDALMDELAIDHVDLLKMDIEGSEDLALRGMQAGLSQRRYERILLEVHPGLLAEKGKTVREGCQQLVAAGYRAWWIDHSPAALRRAAYARLLDPADFLSSASLEGPCDAWPHLLWLSPAVDRSVL